MLLIKRFSRVLAIGAHPDDIELGAGGFIRRLVTEFDAVVTFLILTDGLQAPGHGETYSPDQRRGEARDAANHLCEPKEPNVPWKEPTVLVGRFHDCTLDKNGHETIKAIEAELYENGPDRVPRFDIILSHAEADTHADHRTTHESTLSAARDFHGTLLLYQAPSTKPNGFRPTLFVKLNTAAIDRKIAALGMHVSQREKPFMADARTRGLAGSWALFLRLPEGTYLEAFEVYKSFI